MNRLAAAMLFALVVALANAARAELPVAPAPREVRPDGSRDPVPQPEPPAKGENPAVTVERIIKNSKDVGDKLEKKDTGTDTRKTQGKILSDIDALINQQENPPPPKPDQDKNDKNDDKKDDKQDKNDKKDDKQDKKDNKQDKNDKKDMGMPKDGTGMDMMPMDGMGDSQPMGRKPRMNDPTGDAKKEKEPGGGAKEHGKPDNDKKSGEQPKNPKGSGDAKGVNPKGGNPTGKANGKPGLPIEEEDASKDVWGHLPDKLRQQMSQYYKDEFTPKYAELLKLYYSSLADKNAKPGEPKK